MPKSVNNEDMIPLYLYPIKIIVTLFAYTLKRDFHK
jgi:hypothetical protein